ncbi:hypothetical protein F2P81_024373 [Scophthalmus maximus]|uniref:Uncharacterized protein n=1 Tax=Scophthalmus maximus TaxID=52904 RepID=A0A6A4RPB4_SCOMX|nr:hypothetical protein F2P81_024373 [Scophthalmus maximus]
MVMKPQRRFSVSIGKCINHEVVVCGGGGHLQRQPSDAAVILTNEHVSCVASAVPLRHDNIFPRSTPKSLCRSMFLQFVFGNRTKDAIWPRDSPTLTRKLTKLKRTLLIDTNISEPTSGFRMYSSRDTFVLLNF